MQAIKLYGYSTSPFVPKTRLFLYYKGIPFEFVPVNPIYNKEIAFTEQTQVPVLQIGDKWKLDSTEQAIWLDELYPVSITHLFTWTLAFVPKILREASSRSNNCRLFISYLGIAKLILPLSLEAIYIPGF